ncbi:PREDICTED: UPF0544 protein C5orf45 homolog [Dufourea novaeangliae]|uniref:UPF0544 protein C5orf45 homolog n=1 Tax=Dufourea novaeangliae TaxID=178035 RepID=UPI000767D38E|nr:PREDICTED: UPF0544 protein C5orf45 homolog [Dufourea novaeangliae]
MSQQMNILCCFSCNMYQVHIVKKAKKWQCKLCNAKQSFRRVQKLNAMKEYESPMNPSFEMATDVYLGSNQDHYPDQPRLEVLENKWAKYLDTSDDKQFNSYDTSNNDICNDKANDDSLYSQNTKTHGSSQSNHVHSNSYYPNDSKENFNNDNSKEYDNLIEQDTSDNMLIANNDSKNSDLHDKSAVEIKDAKNIFDDNEDFDLIMDF